jgi:cellulase
MLTSLFRNPWHIWDYGPFYGNGNDSGIPDGINSIQRRWYFWPIYDIYSGNMTCNFDGAETNNSLHASVVAGSTITAQYNAQNFTLTTVDKTLWYHQFGPLLVYMAHCPGSSCAGFDGKGAVWFKIAQYGLAPDVKNLRGPWLQATMLTGENATGWPVTIPQNLKGGNYLLRHEVINLQSDKDYGPQFYVECAQLKVEGKGNGFPSSEYMASFPGAYNYSGLYRKLSNR